MKLLPSSKMLDFCTKKHPKFGIKYKKITRVIIWSLRIWLRRRTTTTFNPTDTWGPKHVCKNLFYHFQCSRKSFTPLWNDSSLSSTFNFETLEIQNTPPPIDCLRQNRHHHTYVVLKFDWCVVWSPQSLSRNASVLSMLARTYNVITSVLEHFLEHFEAPWAFMQYSTFEGFQAKMLQNGYWELKISCGVRLDA